MLVWLFGLVALAALIALSFFGLLPLDRLTPLVFDAYQRIQPRAETGGAVTVVDIDEASIAKLGQWPWSRAIIAHMVDRLGQLGAVTIAFDVVFSEPDRTSLSEAAKNLEQAGAKVELPAGQLPDNDAALAAAFSRNNVVAGFVLSNETQTVLPKPKAGFAYGGSDPKGYLTRFGGGVPNLRPLSDAASGLAFYSFPPSIDGLVRVIPLMATAQDQIYPTLALEALRLAQGAQSFTIRSSDASGDTGAGTAAMTTLRVGAIDVPTGPHGEMYVYFSGLKSMPTISAADLLDPAKSAALAEQVGGHIVFVGTSAVGLRDLVATPTDASEPGVRVHAEIVDQILGQTFLSRPDWAPGAETFAAGLLGLILLLVAQRAGTVVSAVTAVALIVIAVAGSWAGFHQFKLLLDPILPGGAVLVVFVVTMPVLLLITDREKQFVRGAFGRYLSPTLVGRLADNPNALKLGGELRDLTILFSDIRSFTSLSENLAPDELTNLLNSFLTPMTDVLLKSEATIDKYMGDAIMAFWNAPLDIAEHPRKAVLSALRMLEALEQLNRERGSSLRVGIGLNSGPACVGNLGSAQRFSYSAIGDSVNLASRVEGLTKSYGVSVLVTESTRLAAPEMAYIEVDLVRVVGRAEPVPVHTLLGDADYAARPDYQTLASAHKAMIAAYRAADVTGAETAMQAARAAAPGWLEKLYDKYAERLDAMRHEPPPDGWDGVFTATEKH